MESILDFLRAANEERGQTNHGDQRKSVVAISGSRNSSNKKPSGLYTVTSGPTALPVLMHREVD